jgi:hypothetical protein
MVGKKIPWLTVATLTGGFSGCISQPYHRTTNFNEHDGLMDILFPVGGAIFGLVIGALLEKPAGTLYEKLDQWVKRD